MVSRIMIFILLLVFSFLLFSCVEPADNAVPYNEKISGVVEADQTVNYDFKGTEDLHIFISHLSCDHPVVFTLTDPDGTELFRETGLPARHDLVNVGPISLEKEGIYKLVVELEQEANEISGFDFIVWHVDPVIIDGGNLEFAILYEGETEISGQTIKYTFEGSVEQVIILVQEYSHQHVTYKLSDPDDEIIFAITGYGKGKASKPISGPTLLQKEGIYTLVVGPEWIDRTASYRFRIWEVSPVTIEGGTVAYGQTYSGATTIPGQTATYFIEGIVGQKVGINLLDLSGDTNIRLKDPEGEVVFDENQKVGPVIELESVIIEKNGLYELTIYPIYDNLIEFNFTVSELVDKKKCKSCFGQV